MLDNKIIIINLVTQSSITFTWYFYMFSLFRKTFWMFSQINSVPARFKETFTHTLHYHDHFKWLQLSLICSMLHIIAGNICFQFQCTFLFQLIYLLIVFTASFLFIFTIKLRAAVLLLLLFSRFSMFYVC